MNEEKEALNAIIGAAWEVVLGHASGRRNRPGKHLCNSCTENIALLREALTAYNLQLSEHKEG